MIKRKMLLSVLGLALTVTMVASACQPSAPPAPQTEPTPTATQPTTPASAPPTVKITAPANGATLTSGTVQVSIEVSNFTIVTPGSPNAAGQGHVHYYLDVEIPTTPGQAAVTAAGTYKAVQATSVTWENLSPGTHTLGVQLVNNNHTPLSTPVTATVTITVAAATPTATQPTTPASAPPTVKITAPANGATLTSGTVQVSIEVSNFTIVTPGSPNAAGQGHVHYYLDVEIPTTPGQRAVTAAGTYKAVQATSVTWENLSPGTHTLGVQLVNSDHTPLSTPVTATVTITVTAGGGIYNY